MARPRGLPLIWTECTLLISENVLKNKGCTATEVRDKNTPGHPNENPIDLMSENNKRFIQKSADTFTRWKTNKISCLIIIVARTRGKLELSHDYDRIEQIVQPGCISPSRKTKYLMKLLMLFWNYQKCIILVHLSHHIKKDNHYFLSSLSLKGCTNGISLTMTECCWAQNYE